VADEPTCQRPGAGADQRPCACVASGMADHRPRTRAD
jgi:hypothetical protein